MIVGEWINGEAGLEEALSVRARVFGAAGGRDENDAYAMHCVMSDSDTGAVVGTGRIRLSGAKFCIDRICVLPEYRGQYVGDLMTRLMLYRASQFAGEVRLVSPAEVAGFFARYGFAAEGEEEGGVAMRVLKEGIRFPSKCGRDEAQTLIGGEE